MRNLAMIMGAAAFIISVTATFAAPAGAAPGNRVRTPGNAQARAPVAINRPKPANAAQRPDRAAARANAGATRQPRPENTRPNRGPTHIAAGNTVIVAPGHPSNGYYNNGNYHSPRDWDDNDDDFLDFVGKTAAITAGASIVTAVIGSVVNSKPQDAGCQETISNGQAYVNCNGTWYQAVPPAGAAPTQPQYQVVAPPPGTSK